jgi:hypothetical protein
MQVAVVRTELDDSFEAGASLGRAILEKLDGESPNAVVLFASPVFDPNSLLEGLHAACDPGAVVGCSSAGEFTFESPSTSSAVALAIRSDDFRFTVHSAGDLQADISAAATTLASGFHLGGDPQFPHRTALVLMDTLAGYGEEFLDVFTAETSGMYQVVGGGAADDAAFLETFVFAGREAIPDAVVALEIRSRHPVGIGVSHGWTPASHPMTVTAADGLRLIALDGRPAADVIESFARERDLTFDRESPLPFFLHHVLGITTNDGHKLRVPLKVNEDGSIVCAAEVPEGATLRVMETRSTSSAEAAAAAARKAWLGLKGREPGMVIFFDCAATRLRLGDDFGTSVDEILSTLGTAACAGCNTYGQFARLEGQFSGYHNCTAVVCALPG